MKAAELALQKKDVTPVLKWVAEEDEREIRDAFAQTLAVRDGIHRRFSEVSARKDHAGTSVEAGREFVEAYVQYVHFIEATHNLVAQGASHSRGDTAPSLLIPLLQ